MLDSAGQKSAHPHQAAPGSYNMAYWKTYRVLQIQESPGFSVFEISLDSYDLETFINLPYFRKLWPGSLFSHTVNARPLSRYNPRSYRSPSYRLQENSLVAVCARWIFFACNS